MSRWLCRVAGIAVAIATVLAPAGCILNPPAPHPPSSSRATPTVDLGEVVRAVPGVSRAEVSSSPAKFGTPESVSVYVVAAAGADPLDVLDRVLFASSCWGAQTTSVIVDQAGKRHFSEEVGVPDPAKPAELKQRYGACTDPRAFPLPSPARPSPTPR